MMSTAEEVKAEMFGDNPPAKDNWALASESGLGE